jgi:phosphatidylinositol-bisphosphatase
MHLSSLYSSITIFFLKRLQEMETNRDAYIRHDPTKEKLWVKTILDSLKDGGKDYYRVESYQLVTMLLIIIAKTDHQDHITEVQKTYAGVGLMNVLVRIRPGDKCVFC